MALTSTLYTGLSGLNANQTWLNVIGNNIANVNTSAFKASQVAFSPQFYVTDQPGSAPDTNFGGTDPSQHGLGTQVATISKDFTPGSIQTTGVSSDLAINGNGFFVLNSSAGQQFTRDGQFTFNSNNQLVTTAGAFVQGFGADTNGNILTGALQNINVPLGQSSEARATQNATLQGNLNAGGDVAAGASILTSQPIQTIDASNLTGSTLLTNLETTASTPATLFTSGDTLSLAGTKGSRQLPNQTLAVTGTTTVSDLENFFNESLGIDTSVSESGNPPPGATLQASGATGNLAIIGNTGTANALTLGSAGLVDTATGGTTSSPLTISSGTFTSGSNTYTDGAIGESTHTTITAFDSLGTPITVDLTTVLESKSDSGNVWRFYATSPDNQGNTGPVVGTGTLTFDNTGQLKSSTGTTLTISRTGTGAGTPVVMTLNFNGTTSLASNTSDVVMSNQDGEPLGTLSSFSIGGDGKITGAFTNGLTKTLGQVALASFNNPEGLIDEGGGVYQTGANSGVAAIAGPGTENTGSIQAGALEQSNVDLSKEFINLIIASTGFSSASKVISTSDQLLTELLNTQR